MVDTLRSPDGTTIAYQRAGTGPALILVGGALSTRQSASPYMPLLSSRFTVYVYDRRGRGDSGNTLPYAVAREVEDLEALIDAAGGSAYVHGHSSGAILALETAAQSPRITQLAAYEPPYLTNQNAAESSSDFASSLQSAIDTGHPDQAVEMFIRRTGSDFDESIKQTPWWPGMVAVAPTLPYDIAITGDASVPAERLAKITAKTLGIYGGASPAWAKESIDAVTAAIPGATQAVAEGQTHAAAPEVVTSILLNFFT